MSLVIRVIDSVIALKLLNFLTCVDFTQTDFIAPLTHLVKSWTK